MGKDGQDLAPYNSILIVLMILYLSWLMTAPADSRYIIANVHMWYNFNMCADVRLCPWVMAVIVLISRKHHVYVDDLKGSSLHSRILVYTYYASGNSAGSLLYMKVPEGISEETLVSKNAEVLRVIKPSLPVYHTRAMKKQFYHDMCLFRCGKPAVLRDIYRRLTGKICVNMWVYVNVWACAHTFCSQ